MTKNFNKEILLESSYKEYKFKKYDLIYLNDKAEHCLIYFGKGKTYNDFKFIDCSNKIGIIINIDYSGQFKEETWFEIEIIYNNKKYTITVSLDKIDYTKTVDLNNEFKTTDEKQRYFEISNI